MGASDNALRGLEAGTKAGYLVLLGAAAWALWYFFGKKGVTRVVVPPPVAPAGDGDPSNSGTAGASDTGITAGGLVEGVRARIIDPGRDSRVYRNVLSSNFDAVIEVVSEKSTTQNVVIEVVGDFYELTGGQRLGVRTQFGPYSIPPGATEHFNVEIDSGNINSTTFEFGQANAVLNVYTNGLQTQTTSAEVW